ncbi:MAG: hypothetical protein ACLT4C_11790 [Butyricicoccus sp.]
MMRCSGWREDAPFDDKADRLYRTAKAQQEQYDDLLFPFRGGGRGCRRDRRGHGFVVAGVLAGEHAHEFARDAARL